MNATNEIFARDLTDRSKDPANRNGPGDGLASQGRFTSANLSGADLTGASLTGASLIGARRCAWAGLRADASGPR
ncbi:pentapeptide repeat-containing protein [Pannonibacter phragmitetus]|uniref:pentapeptide repeat-containing protein n=1 Tax=Pannonibacter phragmitetus TaxID=121719 RepID=UPI000B97552C|nr:pentapeptide repeat-containing protein [Pannonibacter phragmitetus]